MNTFGDTLIVFYLDWVNNFISVQAMADHYGLSFDECLNLIEVARSYYNRNNC